MEDLYAVLKMMHKHVRIISRQSGMYYCLDDYNSNSTLYIHNEIYEKGSQIVAITSGKSWSAMLYKDNTLEIFNRKDGSLLDTFDNVINMFKKNIYNDTCSTLTLDDKNDYNRVIIINNLEPIIISIYDNVVHREFDDKKPIEFKIKTLNNGVEQLIGINKQMEGVVVSEIKC